MNILFKTLVLGMLMAFMAAMYVPVVPIQSAKQSEPAAPPTPRVKPGRDALEMTRVKLALTSYLADKYKQSVEGTHRIVKAAYLEGTRQGVPPLLILAMVEKESSLRAGVVNYYGAVGLMQVVPRYHPEKLVDLKDPAELQVPEVNIRVGSRILAEYLRSSKGNLSAALARYSGGAHDYALRVGVFQQELEEVSSVARSNLRLEI
jgi:soluble lytic murein transglycosylase-like protein